MIATDITRIIFDWGDTVVVDGASHAGAMYRWPKVELVEKAAECLYSGSVGELDRVHHECG